MRYQNIDWDTMWLESRAHKSWKKKKSSDWDRRAAGFAERNLDSPFVAQFLSRLQVEPEWSVLDVGCGPGTLAIPLARQVRRITALDYSAAMLDELGKRARQESLTNIRTIQGSWDDDWQKLSIARHDIAIASRSLSVDNLADALRKLKPMPDEEARVIAHLPGKGRHAGRMGALLLVLPDGQQFALGTGFSDAQRADPPPVGAVVTYRYRDRTPRGLPRFASFLRVQPQ